MGLGPSLNPKFLRCNLLMLETRSNRLAVRWKSCASPRDSLVRSRFDGCLKCTATMEALLIDTNTKWGTFDVEAGASLEPDHILAVNCGPQKCHDIPTILHRMRPRN